MELKEDFDWPSDLPPLVADATSTLLSRPIQIEKYGIIYAAGGKNIPAGVTLVIIKEQLLSDRLPHPLTPQVMDYRKIGGNAKDCLSLFHYFGEASQSSPFLLSFQVDFSLSLRRSKAAQILLHFGESTFSPSHFGIFRTLLDHWME
jgi:hypothetical protein